MGIAVRLRVRVVVRFMVMVRVSIGVYFVILVCKIMVLFPVFYAFHIYIPHYTRALI